MIGWALFLLILGMTSLEIYILLQVGALLGPTAGFLLVMFTAMFGGWLAQREGFSVLADLRRELERGLPPGDRIMEGVMVLVGGLLLVTPGLVTDALGLSLIFPLTRRFIAPRLLGWLSSQVNVQMVGDFSVNLEEPSEPLGDEVRYRDPLRPPHRSPQGAEPARPFANKFDDLP